MRSASAGVLLLGALFLPSMGSAKTPEPKAGQMIDAGTIWRLDNSAVQREYRIKKGELLLDLPMLPDKLVRIERDVVDVGTTGVKISKGKQFFSQRLANGNEVFCSTRTLDFLKDGGSIFSFRYSGTFACLIDSDGDRLLDGVYEVRTQTQSGIPTITHGKDSGYERIEPVSYVEIDRAEYDNPMKMRLRWRSGSGQDGRAKFGISIENKDREATYVEGDTGAPGFAVPGQFEFGGLLIGLAAEGRGVLVVKTEPMVGKPVFATRGMQIGFLLLD